MEAITTASETRDQFLQLLVTQLRHQDPLEPTKQEDFLSQLAQFSTLEGIEKLNENFEHFLSTQEDGPQSQNDLPAELQQFRNVASAASLVGKQISFATGGPEIESPPATGVVDSVVLEQDAVLVRVDGNLVPLEAVREIGGPEPDA